MRAVRKEKANRLSFREIAFGASDRWRLPFRFLSIRRESRACPLIGCEVADFFCNLGGTTESLRPMIGRGTLFLFYK